MKYPERWKSIRVRILDSGEVYYRDAFENRDVLAGRIGSKAKEGAKSPGGMVTNTVWTARMEGEGVPTQEFQSKTQAVEYLLPEN